MDDFSGGYAVDDGLWERYDAACPVGGGGADVISISVIVGRNAGNGGADTAAVGLWKRCAAVGRCHDGAIALSIVPVDAFTFGN